MKKFFKLIMLVMIFGLITVNRSFAGWPFNRTPAIEGVITDATTGEPVEKVVVLCGWLKSVPSVGGDVTNSFTSEVCVTGKDGKYKIPAKTTLHLLSKFSGTRTEFCHPLYETKREYGDSNGIMVDHVEVNKSSDGIVHADMKLMGVGEKYLGEVARRSSLVASGEGKEEVQSSKLKVEAPIRNDGLESSPVSNGVKMSEEEKKRYYEMGASFCSYLTVHENGWYWLTLKEKNIPFDLEETFKVWDEIGNMYSKFNGNLPIYLKDAKESIRNKLGDKKQ